MTQIIIVTMKEVIRKRIVLLLGIGTILFLAIYGIISALSHNALQQGSFIMNSAFYMSAFGLYFSNMITAFLLIMTAVGSISSEVESGILPSVITRPIKRREYILGKYLGLAVMITAYSVFLYLSVILLSVVFNTPSIENISLWKLFCGMLIFAMQPLVLLSLCFYGSVSFKTLNNGIFVIFLYILGLIGGMMEGMGVMISNDILYKWGIISSLISPFDNLYRKMISVLYGESGLTNPVMPGASLLPSTLPSNWMLVYIAVYALIFLLLAMRKFEKKDL